ncbi:hypothetical protein FNJ88_08200 [Chryseobacterium sp. SNU WT5]|uniref:glycosyltransferase family 2 protein n=1 Tax=Chryseobacterium sp. SNU WT5 TaxID=2594269 RepID=UPI00117EC5C5|nr:glycosyltransferase [Chryseobacterium sp. SNU WT5]QDP85541.1 hypothetical protein FNJ88_08200 [Chryseobacterium sp. SNU WT5]
MEKLPISICILSWNNVKTLENTLKSYQKFGLLEMSEDIVVLFQEASEKDVKLAETYQLKTIILKENIGIGKAIKILAENAKFENILFLENDWQLIENENTTFHQLKIGLDFLNKKYDVVRYRSRKKPGYPLHSLKHKGNELDYFDDWHNCTSPHLLESLHWLDPAKEFPDKIQKDGNFFVTTSRWANWTNNPFLVKKSFLLDKILSFAGESVYFERNIAEWWTKQNFKIAQGEGLFMHNDLAKYPKKNLFTKIIKRIKNLK